ncbi:MAG: ribokinase [Acidobacteriaceae bacterium]|nr:ribokinase [Acidobacteriaceae bacterium]
MNKKIVVVGSINLDLVASVSHMPGNGETLMGEGFATYPGGKGANQAVAASRLGAEVAMVGHLGNDLFAERLREGLNEAGVNTEHVRQVDEPSGCAVILVIPQGGNSIVVIPGANYSLRPEHLEEHVELLQSATLILAQLEIPLETVERLGLLAAQLHIPFVLDPAPAQVLSKTLLESVTWLTPNESETRSILKDLGYSIMEDTIDDDALSIVASRILAAGVRNIILTLGARGIYLAGKDVPTSLIPTYRVQVIDSTAAGDAFNGGFAYALTQGMEPLDAARFGCAVAAVSVTRVGAQPSMPTLSEVEELLNLARMQPNRYCRQSN